MMERFHPPVARTSGYAGTMPRQHLLVLGAPRTGTTLLGAMLGNHPDVAILHEVDRPDELSILGKSVVGNKLCIPYNIELDRRRNPLLGGVYGVRYLGWLAHEFGLPFHTWSIRMYQDNNPELRIFATLRDADAVIASNRRNTRFTDAAARRWWVRALGVLHNLWQESPDRVSIVLFDRLVTEPRTVIERLLDRLGLPFDDAVMEGYRHTPQYHGNRGIDGSKASWKNGADISLIRGRPDLIQAYDDLAQASV